MMGQEVSKSPTVANDETPEWTLLYHQFNPPFPGRGQAIRFMFVDAGVKYVESGKNLYGPDGFCDLFRGTGANKKVYVKALAQKHSAPFPVAAPPIIWHRRSDGKEVFLNQLPAILRYVGTVLGYAPTDPIEVAIADKVMLDVCDYVTEGRGSFHPVDGNASYSIQKEEGDKKSLEWTTRRMLIWLNMFEKVLDKSSSDYVIGNSPSYADFSLYWACQATEAQFDNKFYKFAWKNADVPKLKAFKKRFDERPNIASWTGMYEYSGDSMM